MNNIENNIKPIMIKKLLTALPKEMKTDKEIKKEIIPFLKNLKSKDYDLNLQNDEDKNYLLALSDVYEKITNQELVIKKSAKKTTSWDQDKDIVYLNNIDLDLSVAILREEMKNNFLNFHKERKTLQDLENKDILFRSPIETTIEDLKLRENQLMKFNDYITSPEFKMNVETEAVKLVDSLVVEQHKESNGDLLVENWNNTIENTSSKYIRQTKEFSTKKEKPLTYPENFQKSSRTKLGYKQSLTNKLSMETIIEGNFVNNDKIYSSEEVIDFLKIKNEFNAVENPFLWYVKNKEAVVENVDFLQEKGYEKNTIEKLTKESFLSNEDFKNSTFNLKEIDFFSRSFWLQNQNLKNDINELVACKEFENNMYQVGILEGLDFNDLVKESNEYDKNIYQENLFGVDRTKPKVNEEVQMIEGILNLPLENKLEKER